MYGASTGLPGIKRSAMFTVCDCQSSTGLPVGHSMGTRKIPYQNDPIAMYGVPSASSMIPASIALNVLPGLFGSRPVAGEDTTRPWSTHS